MVPLARYYKYFAVYLCSSRMSKQPIIGCCMVFLTLYIEHTRIKYEVAITSHFPSCDSNYNAADLCEEQNEVNQTMVQSTMQNMQLSRSKRAYKFSLVINCHRVLNNNSYILRLRFRLQENKKVINRSTFKE